MPNLQIRHLIHDLQNTYAGDPWYGDSVTKILGDITPDIAFARPLPGRHAIAELLAHLVGWREFLNRRLQGDARFAIAQTESFDWTRTHPDPEKAWPMLLEALESGQQQIIAGLEQADDTLLDTQVPGRNYDFRQLIQGVIHHDIYHAGQIAILKKAES
ncbi:DinB family protein [Compostibacter hankyongensis]|uniref:DinB-like domain-containing protein n=1 Tax=Compostibacter hankyongensis TaxID=1007089 RepID=A0ABP8FNF6_9BACT